MTDDQIKKLTRVVLGIEKISSFTEMEIEELEKKSGNKNNFVVA